MKIIVQFQYLKISYLYFFLSNYASGKIRGITGVKYSSHPGSVDNKTGGVLRKRSELDSGYEKHNERGKYNVAVYGAKQTNLQT